MWPKQGWQRLTKSVVDFRGGVAGKPKLFACAMIETTSSNRVPVTIAVIALAVLLAIGGYLFWRNSEGAPAEPGGDQAKVASSAADQAVSIAGMNSDDRKATEAVVRAYILENPEIISEAVEILQQRQVAARIAAVGPAIAKPFYSAEAGNPDGDVTVIEFTDYNCGYCRSSVVDVEKLVASDKNIRLIHREVPILAPSSREAALWALAAAKQGKHKSFYKAMFTGGRPDEKTIRAAAVRAGLDMAAAQKFASSAEAAEEVDANLSMFQQIGLGGTPAFVIENKMLEGAVGFDALKAAVGKART